VFASNPAAPADFQPIGLWRPSFRCLISSWQLPDRKWRTKILNILKQSSGS
jgi:hypothetical protein